MFITPLKQRMFRRSRLELDMPFNIWDWGWDGMGCGTRTSLQTLGGKTHQGRYFVAYREQILCFNQDRNRHWGKWARDPGPIPRGSMGLGFRNKAEASLLNLCQGISYQSWINSKADLISSALYWAKVPFSWECYWSKAWDKVEHPGEIKWLPLWIEKACG